MIEHRNLLRCMACAALMILVAGFAPAQTSEPKPAPAPAGVERILYFQNGESLPQMQECATVIRATAEIRELSVDQQRRAIQLRATPDQAALAEWLFAEFHNPGNRPVPGQPRSDLAIHEFRRAGSGGDLVRVFFVPQTETPQEFQEISTLVRMMTNTRWAFTYNSPRALTLRGTAEQMALADWLIGKLVLEAPADRSGPEEYPLASGGEVVRVFYLRNVAGWERLHQIANEIRSVEGGPRYMAAYSRARAIAALGSSARVSAAEAMIQTRDR